jgi:hypothetical protein
MRPPQSGTIHLNQSVDPVVSETKFNVALSDFKQIEAINRERGVFLIRAQFPDIVLAFAAARIRPAIIVFAVKINFTNYDLEAPSVQFVDPLTEKPLKMNEIWSYMDRKLPTTGQLQTIPLIQSHAPNFIPFLCLPGVREYHHHSRHSNDPWFNHRNTGEGTLGFLVDQLHKYGTNAYTGYGPLQISVRRPNLNTFEVLTQGLKFSADPKLLHL